MQTVELERVMSRFHMDLETTRSGMLEAINSACDRASAEAKTRSRKDAVELQRRVEVARVDFEIAIISIMNEGQPIYDVTMAVAHTCASIIVGKVKTLESSGNHNGAKDCLVRLHEALYNMILGKEVEHAISESTSFPVDQGGRA
jgi:hypothetical protein